MTTINCKIVNQFYSWLNITRFIFRVAKYSETKVRDTSMSQNNAWQVEMSRAWHFIYVFGHSINEINEMSRAWHFDHYCIYSLDFDYWRFEFLLDCHARNISIKVNTMNCHARDNSIHKYFNYLYFALKYWLLPMEY